MVCMDLAELFDDSRMVLGKAAELGKGFGSLMGKSVWLRCMASIRRVLASSCFSCLMRKRGVSGSRNKPTQMIIDHAN